MTEVKFDTANWFDYNCYQRYLDKKSLRRKLTAIDGVKVFNIDCYKGGRIEAILDKFLEMVRRVTSFIKEHYTTSRCSSRVLQSRSDCSKWS